MNREVFTLISENGGKVVFDGWPFRMDWYTSPRGLTLGVGGPPTDLSLVS